MTVAASSTAIIADVIVLVITWNRVFRNDSNPSNLMRTPSLSTALLHNGQCLHTIPSHSLTLNVSYREHLLLVCLPELLEFGLIDLQGIPSVQYHHPSAFNSRMCSRCRPFRCNPLTSLQPLPFLNATNNLTSWYRCGCSDALQTVC